MSDTSTRPLTLAPLGASVGGALIAPADAEGFVTVGGFDTHACWALGPGWLEVAAHETDVGRARARLHRQPVATTTRHWYLDAPEADESWRGAGSPDLGSLRAKVGGRPGFLQGTPSLKLDSPCFLAQLDCETDLLYPAHRELLCDGALYVFGSVGGSEIVEVVAIWQF